jgi:hypothetical protein
LWFSIFNSKSSREELVPTIAKIILTQKKRRKKREEGEEKEKKNKPAMGISCS